MQGRSEPEVSGFHMQSTIWCVNAEDGWRLHLAFAFQQKTMFDGFDAFAQVENICHIGTGQ